MNIALDYDGTYTKDPELWHAFIASAAARGHRVCCVTMRYPSEPVQMPCDVIYTGRKAKAAHAQAVHQMAFDIWIDDRPEFILLGATA